MASRRLLGVNAGLKPRAPLNNSSSSSSSTSKSSSNSSKESSRNKTYDAVEEVYDEEYYEDEGAYYYDEEDGEYYYYYDYDAGQAAEEEYYYEEYEEVGKDSTSSSNVKSKDTVQTSVRSFKTQKNAYGNNSALKPRVNPASGASTSSESKTGKLRKFVPIEKDNSKESLNESKPSSKTETVIQEPAASELAKTAASYKTKVGAKIGNDRLKPRVNPNGKAVGRTHGAGNYVKKFVPIETKNVDEVVAKTPKTEKSTPIVEVAPASDLAKTAASYKTKIGAKIGNGRLKPRVNPSTGESASKKETSGPVRKFVPVSTNNAVNEDPQVEEMSYEEAAAPVKTTESVKSTRSKAAAPPSNYTRRNLAGAVGSRITRRVK